MIEQLNNLAQSWWDWMWPMFWQVSALIVFVAAIDLLIRRWAWPQLRHALWLLVLVKLVLPPSMSLSTSVTSGLHPIAESAMTQRMEIVPAVAVEPSSETVMSTAPLVDASEPLAELPETAETSATATVTDAAATAGVALSWQGYVLAVWLLGVLGFGVYLIWRMRDLHFRAHAKCLSEPLPPWFARLLADTAKRVKLRHLPTVCVSESIKGPAVYGLFRPVLLLPAGDMNHLSRHEAEHVLLHELSHLKRNDLLAHAAAMLLLIAYWFNPLMWFVRRNLQHLRELCCDASVAGVLREDTPAYRETLLEVARRLLATRTEPGLSFLGLFEDTSRLLNRLDWLEKKTWRYHKLRTMTALAAVGFMLICILPMAKAKTDTQGKPSVQTYIVNFQGQADFNPQTAKDLLDAFNEKHPKGVRTHHYRTKVEKDRLVGLICVDSEKGKDAVIKMLKASDKLEYLADEPATDERLESLKSMGQPGLSSETYIVTFQGKSGFNPKTAKDLLNAFNKKHPKGVRTHHYRTKKEKDRLIGQIQVDGQKGKDAVIKMLKRSDKLEFVGVEPAGEGGSTSQTSNIRTYEVGRNVSKFPDKEDFSTPEAAYATINRLYADNDDPAIWARVSVKKLAKQFARMKKTPKKMPAEWAEVLKNTNILKVWIADGTFAVVAAELPQEFSSKVIRSPIDVRHLELEGGRWLNKGNDRVNTLDEVKEKFDRLCKLASKAADKQPATDRESASRPAIDVRTYDVGRNVSEIPDIEDYSTPYAAYATLNRLYANKTKQKPTQKRLEWAKVLQNANILKVWIAEGTYAVVAAELLQEFSSDIIRNPIDVRHLELEHGHWRNRGNDRVDSLDEAKEIFDRACERRPPKKQGESGVNRSNEPNRLKNRRESLSNLDLGTPAATVKAFTQAAAAGNIEQAMACVSPDSHDYEDTKAMLTGQARPSLNLFFKSIDPDVPAEIVRKDVTGTRCEIAWKVTFKHEFTVEKQTFKAGDTFELDGNLKKVGDRWLIQGI